MCRTSHDTEQKGCAKKIENLVTAITRTTRRSINALLNVHLYTAFACQFPTHRLTLALLRGHRKYQSLVLLPNWLLGVRTLMASTAQLHHVQCLLSTTHYRMVAPPQYCLIGGGPQQHLRPSLEKTVSCPYPRFSRMIKVPCQRLQQVHSHAASRSSC